MECEDLFKALDIHLNEDKTPKISCCEKEENFHFTGTMMICSQCNSTISNIIDNPEWKYYGNNENKTTDPNRCGLPVNMLLPNSSLGTSVSNVSSSNKDIHKVKRFQKWNSMTYKERSRYKIFNEIKHICEKHDIPLIIIKEANSLYTIVSQIKITRGNNRKGLTAACVFYSCKNCGVPRSSREISQLFSLNPIIVTKGIKLFQELMQLNKNSDRIEKTKTINQSDFIERFCYNLSIDETHIESIVKLSKTTIQKNTITENTPPSIAAGCIYYYCQQKNVPISKKDISDICNVSEVTINKCYSKLVKL